MLLLKLQDAEMKKYGTQSMMHFQVHLTASWDREFWCLGHIMGSVLVQSLVTHNTTNMDTFLMFNIHFLGVHTVNKCQPHFLSQSKCILQAGADRKLWSSSDDPWDYRVVTWSLSDL